MREQGDGDPPAGTPPGGRFSAAAPPRSPFPAIAEYGFLSDLETTALVAADGAVEWLCLPRSDGPSVFGALLDRSAGLFRLAPIDQTVPTGRRYLPGTNVLETTWQTKTGWLIVRDALTIGAWYETETRDEAYVRSPGDYQAEHMLVRVLECVNGQVDASLHCEPAFDYDRVGTRWEFATAGYGEAIARGGDGDPSLRLTTDLRVGFEGRAAVAHTTMKEGDRAFVALSWTDPDPAPPRDVDEAAERLDRTEDFWRDWLNQGKFPDHPMRGALQRSALVLKGLTYAPTGALLAAATTSLPEHPGGRRNWDYRFTWVRDSTFALWGLYSLGFASEANSFLYFMQDRIRGGHPLQIMYGIGGEERLEEAALEHLMGYERSQPVRIGNAAFAQHQHDVWGALLDSVYLHMKAGEYLNDADWENLERQVEEAVARWREPDHGIWEVRGEPQHFTTSKIMCWVACDRGARLAESMDRIEEAERWAKAAEAIREDVLANGVNAEGVLVQSYGSDALDASLLLAVLLRFLPADDARVRATVLAIADELTEHGMVRRYRVEETDDGVGGDEGTFVMCSFWLVSALVEIGETERAGTLLELMLTHASPLGLYAEQLDPHTGRLLGNFPQAFSHLALINAVLHVIRAQEERDGGYFGRV
ncbi:MAG TPA: glycoside hydrolase family 15 protein [Actinomycetota bacterium]|nr:glycoside hydrolase family 15 protein [Actinomycetota bacterium]